MTDNDRKRIFQLAKDLVDLIKHASEPFSDAEEAEQDMRMSPVAKATDFILELRSMNMLQLILSERLQEACRNHDIYLSSKGKEKLLHIATEKLIAMVISQMKEDIKEVWRNDTPDE